MPAKTQSQNKNSRKQASFDAADKEAEKKLIEANLEPKFCYVICMTYGQSFQFLGLFY